MPEVAPPTALETTEDAFLGGRLLIRQPKRGHRAGIDAVLLAAAAPVAEGGSELVLDAGAGCGIVGLAVAARVPDARIVAVEIEPELAALARENAEQNGMTARIAVIAADLTAPLAGIADEVLQPGRFQHVLANPPYFEEGGGTTSPEPLRQRAAAMPHGGLDRWMRFLAAMAAPGGTLTLVHRTEALGDILQGLDGRFGGVVLFPLFPRMGAPAGRVIVQAFKGSRAPLRLLPGLVLHETDGRFTDQAAAILRGGEPLVF